MDYRNIVVQSFGYAADGTPVNLYANAGRAHVKGLDLTSEWDPTKAISIAAGVGLLSQNFLRFGIGANGLPIPAASAHFLDSPSITGSATVRYFFSTNDRIGALAIIGGWTFRSRTFFDNSSSITSSQKPYSLFSGKLSYVLPDPHLTFEAYADNIANEVYLTRTVNALGSLGAAYAVFGPPRVYGMRFKYTF